jgi:hypothetical protein
MVEVASANYVWLREGRLGRVMIQLWVRATKNGEYAKLWFRLEAIGSVLPVDTTHCQFWCNGVMWWGGFSADALVTMVNTEKSMHNIR